MRADSIRGDVSAYVTNRDSYDSLTNRVRGAEMAHHIAVIHEQHKYDLALKETERKHISRSLWLGGFTVVVISVSVIILLLYKQSRLRLVNEMAERRRLDSEIEYKRLENELLALKMEQARDELERSRSGNVEAIRQMAVEDGKKSPSTRLGLLEATLNTEHATFIDYIDRKFPHLTHNDKLILGFMRMGLTSHEAAAALGISVDSFQKARYRLRKKMRIASMDELQDFVNGNECC